MMRVRVIVPPAPIVTPADIAGDHDGSDPAVAAVIAAVTEAIDGPDGWLGRSLGPQTLELATNCWETTYDLPFGPVIDVEFILYSDSSGVDQTVEDGLYGVSYETLWFETGWSGPALATRPNPIRIRYQAGYDGDDIDSGGTGPVPERARQAIIQSVSDLLRIQERELGLRSETVEGIGAQTFLDSDVLLTVVEKRCNSLLAGLRVFVL